MSDPIADGIKDVLKQYMPTKKACTQSTAHHAKKSKPAVNIEELGQKYDMVFQELETFGKEHFCLNMNSTKRNNCHCLRDAYFLDWEGFQEKIYKKVQPGFIKRSHIFRCTASRGKTKLSYRLDNRDSSTVTEQEMKRTDLSEARRSEILETEQLTRIPMPGLAPIKQVGLFQNYRKYLPPRYQEETCPQPSQEVMAKVRRQKQESSRQRKRARTA
jgi:hypothetical protein